MLSSERSFLAARDRICLHADRYLAASARTGLNPASPVVLGTLACGQLREQIDEAVLLQPLFLGWPSATQSAVQEKRRVSYEGFGILEKNAMPRIRVKDQLSIFQVLEHEVRVLVRQHRIVTPAYD